MKPQQQHTAYSHPARKAARAAQRANPGFDFEPAIATVAACEVTAAHDSFAAVLAELEREFPRGATTPTPGPLLAYERVPGTLIDMQIKRSAAQLRQLMLDSVERVPFDRADPTDYMSALADTAFIHYDSLLALESPAERYLADAVYHDAGWFQHRGVVPTHSWGKRQMRDFVESFARNLAPLLAEQAELGLEIWE